MSKTQVALLFGGRSGEHEVSRNSAHSVALALAKNYDVFPIGIAKDGQWYGPIPLSGIPEFVPEKHEEKKVTILPNPVSKGTVYSLPSLTPVARPKVYFPVLHGTFGEDGTIQGLLDLAGVPYVGSGVLASAAGMDKVMMKTIFAHNKLPQVPFLSYSRNEIENRPDLVQKEITKELGYPCFVKPANLGSSVGISKVKNQKDLETALKVAADYDRKIIVEKGVSARELEISILGNDEPLVSLPGEIIPCNEFYDYNAKYIDDRSILEIPAKLEKEQIEEIQHLALEAYKALGCSGLSRVDFFLVKDTGEILINEINTIPGFTSISMYPKLWEHSGLPMDELCRKLIYYALERHRDLSRNLTSYTGK